MPTFPPPPRTGDDLRFVGRDAAGLRLAWCPRHGADSRAGATRYGLQCGVFTARLDHAMRAWDRLDVGGVVVGDVPSVRVDAMPYGGVKDSGIGREGVRSTMDEMSEVRLLVVRDPPAGGV